MDPNWTISVVRTVVVPFIVGCLGQLLIFAWAEDVSGGARSVAASLIACAWYIFARLAQTKNPRLGFLLGIAAEPHYNEEESEVAENELLAAIVRTVLPLTVGALVGLLIFVIFDIDEQQWTLLITGLVTLAYYGIVRWIEDKAVPLSTTRKITGTLLGARAVPHY